MKIPIFDAENWKEIGATLARNKTRTFLTGFGIFWGVAMLALLMGGARGAEDMLRRQFAGFATNAAVVWPMRTTMPFRGTPKDKWWSLNTSDLARLRQSVNGLEVVTTSDTRDGASIVNGRFSYAGTVMGVEPNYVKVFEPTLTAGRFINETDVAQERRVVVLGKKIVGEIFPKNPSPLGEKVEIGGVFYTVIGVAMQSNDVQIGNSVDETATIPGSVFRRSYNKGDKIDNLMLVAKSGYKFKNMEPQIRQVLYSNHRIHPEDKSALNYFDISEQFEKVDNLFLGISLLAAFIGASTLLAGVIGIGNIMWVIVKERTQEIGIRRAIGAKPRDIIVQVLSEGVALTFCAGIAGITFATIILGVVQFMTSTPTSVPRFQMNLWQGVEIMMIFIALGTLAGLIPSIKAMRIKPIEAINDK